MRPGYSISSIVPGTQKSGSKFSRKCSRISSAGREVVTFERLETRAERGVHQLLVVAESHQRVAPVEENGAKH